MLKRRIRILAVTGITIVAAALVTAGITGAPAASPAPAAAHVSNTAATATTAAQGVHLVQRGLVKDCVEIELENTGLQISDNGPYKPVSLEPTGSGSCWNLINKYTKKYDGINYTGSAYRDLRGDCLWDKGAALYTAPGPCTTYKSYQTFFGIKYNKGLGWTFSDFYYGLTAEMGVATQQVGGGAAVDMWPTNQGEFDPYWNFP